jgi:hypothetical protein
MGTSTPREVKRVRATWRPVEVRDAADLPYANFLREYARPRRPVVIRGAVDQWPAMRKWTPEFFKTNFADRPVQVGYDAKMPFAEFIDRAVASSAEAPGPYMYRLFLHEHLPEVLADLSPQNPYSFPGRYASPLMLEYYRRPDGFLKLLIGGVGGRFPVMHYDGDESHAAITEIYGDKEFILYPPSDAQYLYPKESPKQHSTVDDPYDQDLERFPLLAKATQYRTVIHPGEMVYVPVGWWHTARALSMSISICQNMVFEWDWKGFMEWTANPSEGNKPVRQQVKRAYVAAAGRVMSALEEFQRRSPRAAKALVLPSRLAPISSEVARDPATRPLRIRMSTG